MTATPALALALLVLASACNSPDGDDDRSAEAPVCRSATGEYRVVMVLDAVEGGEHIRVNDFPLLYTTGIGGMAAPGSSVAFDATPALVTGRNAVTTAVVPAVLGLPVPETGPARFHSWVCSPAGDVVPGTWRPAAAADSAFAAWRLAFEARWPRWQATEDSLYAARPALRDSAEARMSRDVVSRMAGEGPALEMARSWARAHPVAVTAHFTRPGGARPTDGQPSFDGLLRGAPRMAGTAADSARLRAYAVRLRDLNAAADTAALFEAFQLEITDAYAMVQVSRRVRESANGMPDSARFTREARQSVVLGDIEPFEARDVQLRSWAGGRVWELYREGAGNLLEKELSQGVTTYQRIYVAEVDGRLRIVRR